MKKRFQILVNMNSYPIKTQILLIECCFILHNFIRRTQLYVDDYYENGDEGSDSDTDGDETTPVEETEQNDLAASDWRDGIAQSMWESYVLYLANREI